MTRGDFRAMITYLMAIAIGLGLVYGFWTLWAIPKLQAMSEQLG